MSAEETRPAEGAPHLPDLAASCGDWDDIEAADLTTSCGDWDDIEAADLTTSCGDWDDIEAADLTDVAADFTAEPTLGDWDGGEAADLATKVSPAVLRAIASLYEQAANVGQATAKATRSISAKISAPALQALRAAAEAAEAVEREREGPFADALAEYYGRPLTDAEREDLPRLFRAVLNYQRKHEADSLDKDAAWLELIAAADKAGLLWGPQREHLPLAPFSTEKAFNALRKGWTHPDPDAWTGALVESGGAVLSVYEWGGLQVRIAPNAATLALWWPETDAHALTKEQIHDMVRRYAGNRGASYGQLGAYLAAQRPHRPWTFDELLRLTEYKRPGGRLTPAQVTEHRNAAKRELFAALVLCSSATVHGRNVLPDMDAVALYAIDGHSFEPGTDVPRTIALAPAGMSAAMQNGEAQQRLGFVRDFFVLPDTPPGRWAAAILAAIRQHWRMKVTTHEVRHETKNGRDVLVYPPITRRLLFELAQPDPPTPTDVLDGSDPGRAVSYFEAAMELLQGKGGKRYGKLPKHVNYWAGEPTRHRDKHGREPWPHTDEAGTKHRARRGVDWRRAWLEQPLDIRPGGADLAELLEVRAASIRARAGLKRGK